MPYTNADLFDHLLASIEALEAHSEVARRVFEEYQLDGSNWFHCSVAYCLEPEPLTATVAHAINPYMTIERRRALLADGAQRGFLVPAGDDAYRLSDRGRAVVETFFSTAHQALAEVPPLEGVDTARLLALLERIVSCIEALPEPAARTIFLIRRRTDPGPQAAVLARIDQAASDLYFFRDDSHLAAWKPYGVSGPVWEALSYLWEGRGADLPQRQIARGLDDAQRRAALDDLIQRGWIAPEGEGYRCTDAGQKLRQATEDETNRLYFAPWEAALDEADRQTLGDLLKALTARLNALADARGG